MARKRKSDAIEVTPAINTWKKENHSRKEKITKQTTKPTTKQQRKQRVRPEHEALGNDGKSEHDLLRRMYMATMLLKVPYPEWQSWHDSSKKRYGVGMDIGGMNYTTGHQLYPSILEAKLEFARQVLPVLQEREEKTKPKTSKKPKPRTRIPPWVKKRLAAGNKNIGTMCRHDAAENGDPTGTASEVKLVLRPALGKGVAVESEYSTRTKTGIELVFRPALRKVAADEGSMELDK